MMCCNKILGAIPGIMCILAGIMFNEYIIAMIFSLDGRIESISIRLRILIFEIFLVSIGILLLRSRNAFMSPPQKVVSRCFGIVIVACGILVHEWSLKIHGDLIRPHYIWIGNVLTICLGGYIIFHGERIFAKLVNPAILLLSITGICMFSEGVARWYDNEPLWRLTNYRGQARNLYKSGLPTKFDPVLGWIPQPHYSGTSELWGTRVTLGDDGIRANDNPDIFGEQCSPILAVGDSFTFGDEVSNHETWPAILEKRLRKPVINAGVFAYGIDQTFLRLKELAPKYQPDVLIFSVVSYDLKRSEYAVSLGANKPYFRIVNNTLQLMNTPIKDQSIQQPRFIHRVSGYSYLLHRVMMRLSPNWWLQGGYRWHESHTGFQGEEIACLLFQELPVFAEHNGIRHIYVLIQETHPPDTSLNAKVDAALTCINTELLSIVDLRPIVADLRNHNIDEYNSLFSQAHMTSKGNAFVAEYLVNAIIQD